MKKIYEKPMVELVKFDVEDIMTTSMPAPIDTAALTKADKDALAGSIKGTTGGYDAVGVYNW